MGKAKVLENLILYFIYYGALKKFEINAYFVKSKIVELRKKNG